MIPGKILVCPSRRSTSNSATHARTVDLSPLPLQRGLVTLLPQQRSHPCQRGRLWQKPASLTERKRQHCRHHQKTRCFIHRRRAGWGSTILIVTFYDFRHLLGIRIILLKKLHRTTYCDAWSTLTLLSNGACGFSG